MRFEKIRVINNYKTNQIKIMNTKKILNGKFLVVAFLALPLFFGLSGVSMAYNQITTQLDPGARGTNVTSLQTFFADNSSIYPEGLITGYYGGLTTAAVNRFQANYGFQQVGRVGPLTLAKINSLMANGGWGNNDIFSPYMYQSSISIGSNMVTLTWSTNENATARVFYSTNPVTINEGDINSVGFGVVNGSVASSNNGASTSQQVSISGLIPNTRYYYMLVSTDTSGNVSLASVNSTFTTTN